MPVLSAELVQSLARRRGDGSQVVSLYLNVDGRSNIRPEDYQQQLDGMIREASAKDSSSTVTADLERISEYVRLKFDRGDAKGLALFVSGETLWEEVILPIPVENRLTVNSAPAVRPLEMVIDENASFGVLATDKQRARLLVVEFGSVVESSEVVDPLPRHDDDKGDWRKDHVKQHASVAVQHHLRNAATEMFELHKRRPFKRLVVCVSSELRSELDKQLHAYLRSKTAGHCHMPMTASDDELVREASSICEQTERKEEDKLVSRLRAGVESGQSVAGLDATLKALFEKRVDTLLLSEGFSAEGWRCSGCSAIATLGRSCPICSTEMTHCDDVVEEAVEEALAQNCHIEFCIGNADLDVSGRIGALLRF